MSGNGANLFSQKEMEWSSMSYEDNYMFILQSYSNACSLSIAPLVIVS